MSLFSVSSISLVGSVESAVGTGPGAESSRRGLSSLVRRRLMGLASDSVGGSIAVHMINQTGWRRRGATETVVSEPTKVWTLLTARTRAGKRVENGYHADAVGDALRILAVFVV
jgi:hypothetical protein